MSDALVWQIIKKNNSKTSKRTHPKTQLTIEKGSLKNKRSPFDSGFANKNAIDVSLDEDGVPVLSIRSPNPAHARRPDRMWRRYVLSGGVRKATAKARKALADVHNRKARRLVFIKVSALCRATYRKNRGVDHTSLVSTTTQ